MQYRVHTDLPVFKSSFSVACQVFELSKSFPKRETYSLTDQIRRSSRSVCVNIAEAWRRRRFEKHFISTLNIAEAEAAETQVWLQFAVECQYLEREQAIEAYDKYNEILAQITHLIRNPQPWLLRDSSN